VDKLIRPVAIVGAGPGDPDLLTVKALRRLREADVVVYDRLVSEPILALVPAGTTRIFAGKQARNHHMPQPEINDLLVSLARVGRRVVRLKGGDPFTFGRGGEEALHLVRNGIPFEIVPGITSSSACAAYAGIPLTHRGLSWSVRFITGHCQDGETLDLDWQGLADPETTLVIYMGVTNARLIAAKLIAAGLPPETPASAINRGTMPEQRTIVTVLGELADRVEQAQLHGPTLLVIGKVVALADELAWFAPAAAGDHEALG
jgi:uroporphyrin-III C-methyltransferase/precorrin-2 dehydrogenase/sirohydrochlorin ferrochelatase/uroporphyrin-III C-methyltransferase